jgi:hypothetical protein
MQILGEGDSASLFGPVVSDRFVLPLHVPPDAPAIFVGQSRAILQHNPDSISRPWQTFLGQP